MRESLRQWRRICNWAYCLCFWVGRVALETEWRRINSSVLPILDIGGMWRPEKLTTKHPNLFFSGKKKWKKQRQGSCHNSSPSASGKIKAELWPLHFFSSLYLQTLLVNQSYVCLMAASTEINISPKTSVDWPVMENTKVIIRTVQVASY